MTFLRQTQRAIAVAMLFSFAVLIAACGADSGGVRTVSIDAAADTLFENPPADLVVLDIRTPQEFDEARLAGSVMLDFYEADFATQLAELDRDVPYLMYCRSGNRSNAARTMMEDLGFTNVSEVDGGINAWVQGGQPVITD